MNQSTASKVTEILSRVDPKIAAKVIEKLNTSNTAAAACIWFCAGHSKVGRGH